jgi:hypothetical protein
MLQRRVFQSICSVLTQQGMSDDDIERGLEYADLQGARTTREGYVLAMSRVLYTDDQLASGSVFSFAV